MGGGIFTYVYIESLKNFLESNQPGKLKTWVEAFSGSVHLKLAFYSGMPHIWPYNEKLLGHLRLDFKMKL